MKMNLVLKRSLSCFKTRGLRWLSNSSSSSSSSSTSYELEIRGKVGLKRTKWKPLWPPGIEKEEFDILVDGRMSSESVKYFPDDSDGHGSAKMSNLHLQDDAKFKYDLVVKCDKLRDLELKKGGAGWPLVFKKNHPLWYQDKHARFDPSKKNDVITVAVSGIYNTGKTFLINNLCNLGLPSSQAVHTEGISIKQLEEDNILLLDTAGQNSPITIMHDDSVISDKVSSELILENTLYDLASFHVCMVSELTWQSQKHFEMLYKRVKESRDSNTNGMKNFPILVIHNLSKYSLSDLEKFLFDNGSNSRDKRSSMEQLYPGGSFEVSNIGNRSDIKKNIRKFIREIKERCESTQGAIAAYWDKTRLKQEFSNTSDNFWFSSKDGNVRHLFLVDNNSLSGQVFNYYVFRQIKSILSQHKGLTHQFSLTGVFEVLDKQVKEFVSFRPGVNNDEADGSQGYDSSVSSEDYSKSNQDSVNLSVVYCGVNANDAQDYRLMLHPILVKQNLEIDLKEVLELEYNSLYRRAMAFNPAWDIQYLKGECRVFVEIPGIITFQYSVSQDDRCIRIKGLRFQEKEYKPRISNDDKYARHLPRGEAQEAVIDTVIKFKESFSPASSKHCTVKQENGVLIFIVPELEKEEFIRFDNSIE